MKRLFVLTPEARNDLKDILLDIARIIPIPPNVSERNFTTAFSRWADLPASVITTMNSSAGSIASGTSILTWPMGNDRDAGTGKSRSQRVQIFLSTESLGLQAVPSRSFTRFPGLMLDIRIFQARRLVDDAATSKRRRPWLVPAQCRPTQLPCLAAGGLLRCRSLLCVRRNRRVCGRDQTALRRIRHRPR